MIDKIRKKCEEKISLNEKIWDFLELIMYMLVAFLFAFLIVKFVGQRTVVDGDSMNNTLKNGDNIIVEKLSYTFGDVERYDIIVFPYYDETRGREINLIKRVIGMPGETIQIKNGLIYITNDKGETKILPDKYGYYCDGKPMDGYMANEPVKIPNGYYFVLGDNRNRSTDSRMIGLVNEDIILGKAWLRFFPFSEFGFVSHR